MKRKLPIILLLIFVALTLAFALIRVKKTAGEADVMITEIMEAGFYVGQDDRLAAPLIYEPFTHGELGVLMPKGSEDLLAYVNAFLEGETASGRIDELAEEYIYRYIKTEEQLPSAA